MTGSQPLGRSARTRVLERYFGAIRMRAWEELADCLAPDVRRTGPYRDVVEGREAYVAFLARVVPALPNHALDVSRIRWLADGGALAEISERLDVEGVRTEFPEALIFEFDETGRIRQIDIYLMQAPR